MPIKLEKIAEVFLQYLKVHKKYSPLTIQAYTQDLCDFSIFLQQEFEINDLEAITPAHVRNWMAFMKQKGSKSTSINRRVSALKSFFKYCLREGVIKSIPTDGLITPRNAKKLPQFVDSKDMLTLLQEVEFPINYEGLLDKLILSLLYNTGLRQAELLTLELQNVSVVAQTIKVLGKGNKERIIPISKQLVVLIDEYVHARSLLPENTSKNFFITTAGRPLYAKYVYNTVKRYLSLVTTITSKSPHILRHSFATHLSVQGADINAIKELLGHSSLAATQVYLHNNIEQLKTVHKKAHPKA